MDLNTLISGIAAIIAGLSAIASIINSRKSIARADQANKHAQESSKSSLKANEYAKLANQFANEANQHSKNANLIQANEWTAQYFHDTKIWADEACNCLALAIHLHELVDEDEIRNECVRIRSKLSSIIDRGRWYFPNKWHKEYGLDKESAYRGKRQPLIDSLVFAYNVIGETPVSESQFYSDLVGVQRFFVSEIQKVLNPRKRKEEIGIIQERFKILDDLKNSEEPSFNKN